MGISISSTAPHWLGPNNLMTAADGVYISYRLPTAPFPLVPIHILFLCLGRMGGCPVMGGSHAMPSPTHPPPPVTSLPEGGRGGLDAWFYCWAVRLLLVYCLPRHWTK